MNFILEEIFLSSTSLPLWLNQEEYLEINYISIEKWRWANVHRSRKVSLAEFVDTKAVRSCNTLCKPQSPLGIGQRRTRANGTWRYLFIARISQFRQGWTISLEVIKYSAGISFSKKKKKIITLDFPTESALSVLTAVAKRREKEGRHKGRKEEERKGRGKEWQLFFLCPKGSTIFMVRLRVRDLKYSYHRHILSFQPAIFFFIVLINSGN